MCVLLYPLSGFLCVCGEYRGWYNKLHVLEREILLNPLKSGLACLLPILRQSWGIWHCGVLFLQDFCSSSLFTFSLFCVFLVFCFSVHVASFWMNRGPLPVGWIGTRRNPKEGNYFMCSSSWTLQIRELLIKDVHHIEHFLVSMIFLSILWITCFSILIPLKHEIIWNRKAKSVCKFKGYGFC